jgi:hypothetical protein
MATDFGKLVKSLGIGSGAILAPHIDIFLEDNPSFSPTIKVGGEKIDDGHFHPSGHALLTQEALYKDRLYPVRKPVSAAEKKTFDCGHMWHAYIQAALVEMGFVTEEDVEHHYLWDIPGYDGPMKISGTIDLENVKIPGKGSWLVDIKTASGSTFNRIEEMSLFEKYRAQVNLYGDLSGCKNMLILVIRKDSPHLFKEIQIQRDTDLLAGIYSRWGSVAEKIDADLRT